MDSNIKEDTFDQFLKDRYTPKAPSNLAYRIIEASQSMPQERGRDWFAGIGAFSRKIGQLFQTLQPAVIFASVIMLSVGVFGFSLYKTDIMQVEQAAEYYSEADEVALAFYLDDIFEVGY